jgi:hypothetical protein
MTACEPISASILATLETLTLVLARDRISVPVMDD